MRVALLAGGILLVVALAIGVRLCGSSPGTAKIPTGCYLEAGDPQGGWPWAPASFISPLFIERCIASLPPDTTPWYCRSVLTSVPAPGRAICLRESGPSWLVSFGSGDPGYAQRTKFPARLTGVDGLQIRTQVGLLSLVPTSIDGIPALAGQDQASPGLWVLVGPSFGADDVRWHSLLREFDDPWDLGSVLRVISELCSEWLSDSAARALGQEALPRLHGRAQARGWASKTLAQADASFGMMAGACIVLALSGHFTAECEPLLQHVGSSDPELRAVARWALEVHLLSNLPGVRALDDAELVRAAKLRLGSLGSPMDDG